MSPKLAPFKLERFFAQHEFKAPYLLCCSDCEPLSMSQLLNMADVDSRERWANMKLGYTESQGVPALREAIAGLYERIRADQLVVCVPEEGVYLTMKALLQPGDMVITTYPCYQSLYEIANSIGCQVTHWQPMYVAQPSVEQPSQDTATQQQQPWQQRVLGRLAFDIQDALHLIQPGTKLVVANFPHNPTGATLNLEDWEALMNRCREVQAWLFSDEMYRYMALPPRRPLPCAADCYERAITLCGLSKSWGLPGLRLGWIACQDAQLLQEVLTLKDYTTICNAAPSEVLALAAVRATAKITPHMRDAILANITAAEQFFSRWSDTFEWHPPEGGPIAFPRLKPRESIDKWCKQVVEECGVLLLPASIYDHGDSSDKGHFRIGLGRTNMPECLKQLDKWLVSKYGAR